MKNTKKNKKMFLEQLAKSAVMQITCEKTGIGKSTIYRWREKDKEFSKEIDQAISEGNNLVTDMAVSQLISAIKEKNIGAIKFWLQNHSPEYMNKLHVTAEIEHEEFSLSPELEALVRRGLELVSLEDKTNNDHGK